MKWILLFSPLLCFAAYVGNPANPAIMNSGFFSGGYAFIKGTSGYVYDYTANKRYEAKQTNPDFDPNAAFKKFGIHSQLGSFSLILIERMEIFGSAGGSKEQAKGRPASSSSLEFESRYHFSWSAGSKVVLLQWGKTYLSCDFTYFSIPSSHKSFFRFINRWKLPFEFAKQTLSLNEWQLSGAISSRFAFLTPYIGGTYLRSDLHVSSTPETGSIEYQNTRRWGCFFGFTMSLTGKFHLNFERRVRDESGYTFATIAVF